MIALKQVTKQYGQAAVLKNITLSIDEPGIYCLLGRNGAGKTTLLKSVAGYQNITNGTIQVDGKVITTSTLDTGVSYIENFAKHFNLPVRKLLQIASEVNPNYDYDFASEMMERFELEGKKKFHHLSLGMKTMVSTIICLASNKNAILLDEPVLGFDAIMRVEFYDMLTESFRKHPRIIIVSTHIIEEIAKTYPTPFHLYDEKGIRENAKRVKEAFSWNPGFREYFAIKAISHQWATKRRGSSNPKSERNRSRYCWRSCNGLYL